MNHQSAMIVLSGGQDSTTCLLWALLQPHYKTIHAVSFNYGQRHAVELAAARNVFEHLRTLYPDRIGTHHVMDVRGLLRGRSPLIDTGTPLETYTDYATMNKTIGERVELTFVPLRNPFFLLLAANHALALDCYALVTGICAMDNANYPDCSPAFRQSMELAMRQALGMFRPDYLAANKPQLAVEAPLLYLSKADIVRLALSHPEGRGTMALTHTCYAGQVPPCGRCHACVLRAEGFREAGEADPLVERFS